MTTEARSTGLAGRLVDTANETGRVFDPPRYFTLITKGGRRRAFRRAVVLPRLRFLRLFSAVRFIAHVPFRAVILGRIAMAIGDGLPPRVYDRDEP